MEGVPPTPRKPRSEVRQYKKAKTEKGAKREGKRAKAEKPIVKSESMDLQQSPSTSGRANDEVSAKEEPLINPDPFWVPAPDIKPEPLIKPEPPVKEEPMDDWLYNIEETDPPAAQLSSVALTNRLPSPTQQPVMKASVSPKALLKLSKVTDYPPAVKAEPILRVKLESMDGI